MSTLVGAVQERRARSTGTIVAIIDTQAPGGDWLDPDGGRWVTVCDDHGNVCNHTTLAAARSHAAAPEGWCEPCQDAAEERA